MYMSLPLATFSNAARRRFLKKAMLKAKGQNVHGQGYSTAMAKARGRAAPLVDDNKSELIKDAVSDSLLVDPIEVSMLESASRDIVRNTAQDDLEDAVSLARAYHPQSKTIAESNKQAKNKWRIKKGENRTANSVKNNAVSYNKLDKLGFGYREYHLHTHPNPTGVYASSADNYNLAQAIRDGETARQRVPGSGTRRYINTLTADRKGYNQLSTIPNEATLNNAGIPDSFPDDLRQETKLLKKNALQELIETTPISEDDDYVKEMVNRLAREENIDNESNKFWSKIPKNAQKYISRPNTPKYPAYSYLNVRHSNNTIPIQ